MKKNASLFLLLCCHSFIFSMSKYPEKEIDLLNATVFEDFNPEDFGIENSSFNLMHGFEDIKKEEPIQPNNQNIDIKQIFYQLIAFNIAAKMVNKECVTNLSNAHLSDLKVLDLSGKKLKDLKEDSTRLLQLIESSLALKNILYQKSAIRELEKSANLTTLNLSHNNLNNVPDDFFDITTLEKLDLSDNKFDTIPDKISQLNNLRKLNISKNSLNQVPDQIVQLIHLTDLNLAHNRLSSIPQEITNLTRLQQLDLTENPGLHLSIPLRTQLLSLPNLDPQCFPWG